MISNEEIQEFKMNKNFEKLGEALRHPDPKVRRETILVLATMLNEPAALSLLMTSTLIEQDVLNGMMAKNAVDLAQDPAAVEFLSKGIDIEKKLRPFDSRGQRVSTLPKASRAVEVEVPEEFRSSKSPMRWLWYLVGFWGISSLSFALMILFVVFSDGGFRNVGQAVGLLLTSVAGMIFLWISVRKLKAVKSDTM